MTISERGAQVANILLTAFWVVGLLACLYGLTLCRRLLGRANRREPARSTGFEAERVPVYSARRG